MNVYKIGKYFIAASTVEKAYRKWADESSELDFLFDLVKIEEGSSWTEKITIYRLTSEEIINNLVPCCKDGCNECEESDDYKYYSFEEVIKNKPPEDFPCVLAIEE